MLNTEIWNPFGITFWCCIYNHYCNADILISTFNCLLVNSVQILTILWKLLTHQHFFSSWERVLFQDSGAYACRNHMLIHLFCPNLLLMTKQNINLLEVISAIWFPMHCSFILCWCSVEQVIPFFFVERVLSSSFSVQGDVAIAISLSYFWSDCPHTNTVTRRLSANVLNEKVQECMYTREKAHLTMHSLAVYFEQNSLLLLMF